METGKSYILEKGKILSEGISKEDFDIHTHDASDIISGALPIELGGTGANTAAQARVNLGLSLASMHLIWAHPDLPNITLYSDLDPLRNQTGYSLNVDTTEYNYFVLIYNVPYSPDNRLDMHSTTFYCPYQDGGSVAHGYNSCLVNMNFTRVNPPSYPMTINYNRHMIFNNGTNASFRLIQYTNISKINNENSGGEDVVKYLNYDTSESAHDTSDLIPLYIIAGTV